jgi:hypothetical protein
MFFARFVEITWNISIFSNNKWVDGTKENESTIMRVGYGEGVDGLFLFDSFSSSFYFRVVVAPRFRS